MLRSPIVARSVAIGTGTLGLYWGGVGGVALGTMTGTNFNNSVLGGSDVLFEAFAQLYWESNTAVSVVFYCQDVSSAELLQQLPLAGGTVVTGLTTTSNEALTFGWTWNHTGSGTCNPLNAYVNQVH